MNKIIDLLGNRAEYYLGHTCKTIDKSLIHVPSVSYTHLTLPTKLEV